MRKAINISALIFFIWTLLSALNIPSLFLNFLLVGQLPGTTESLSPSLMLAIMTTVAGIVIFELLARNVELVRRTRQYIVAIIERRERLPFRRFNRI